MIVVQFAGRALSQGLVLAHRRPAECAVGRRLLGVERKLIAAVWTTDFDPEQTLPPANKAAPPSNLPKLGSLAGDRWVPLEACNFPKATSRLMHTLG